MTETTDVVIIGAGPYGLSLAAHLRARRVNFRIFGPAMKFWRDVPDGINLKSLGFATNIDVPERGHSYSEWCRERGLEDFEPCAIKTFAEYGLFMQQRFVPELEEVLVSNVSMAGNRFDVTLNSGRIVNARRVVVCTGLSYLANTPEVLAGLPSTLAQHTSSISDYTQFRGKSVAVIGAGSSAIEAGALVREAGGTSEVFVRGQEVIFHRRSPKHRPIWERIKEPATVFGTGQKHWVVQTLQPILHFLPERHLTRLVESYVGPASPWWIKDRVAGKVPIHAQSEVVAAEASGDRVRLKIVTEGQPAREIEVDHVIAGTGYNWDVTRLSFLDESLRQRIRKTKAAPSLNYNFQSSVKGLYFIGPICSMSFGPMFRFVAGAKFAARSLSRHLARKLPAAKPELVRATRPGLSPQ